MLLTEYVLPEVHEQVLQHQEAAVVELRKCLRVQTIHLPRVHTKKMDVSVIRAQEADLTFTSRPRHCQWEERPALRPRHQTS